MDSPPAEILTVAFPDWEGSACETAVTLKLGGLGMVSGEVYRPSLVIVPKAVFGFPEGIPFTFQFTAELLVPETVAANCWVTGHCAALTFSATEVGKTVTPIVTSMLAEADLVESACAIAVTVTFGGEGGTGGAV